MTLHEYYLERLKAEVPVFIRVLKAIPKDQISYKPHERSPSTEQLVWTLTAELGACLEVVKDYKTEWQNIPAPPLNEMIEKYERCSSELIDRVSGISEADWDRVAQFYYEGKVAWEQPLGAFLWFILFDSIHHRGQISAYLRPMGSKVPSIYGPSADEQGTM